MGMGFSRQRRAAPNHAAYDEYGAPVDHTAVEAAHPPRFPALDEEARAYLRQHGCVVIADVVSPEEIERAKQLFWEHVQQASPKLQRDDASTWGDENWVADPSTGILHTRNVGHSEFVWSIRNLPKVRQVFADLWYTNKLLVSFDRANAFRPWHRPGAPTDWKTSGGWWHVDQSPVARPKMDCVQGLINLYDANEATGGFCVIPGSVQKFSKLKGATHMRDFVRIPAGHDILNTQGQIVCHRAGDLVLWDSRTAHCNSPALVTPTADPNDLLRLTVYVCMTPFSKASAETIRRRKQAFKYMCTTSHWPHTADYHPPKDDEVDQDQAVNPIVMTPEMRELVGYYDNEHDGDAAHEEKKREAS